MPATSKSLPCITTSLEGKYYHPSFYRWAQEVSLAWCCKRSWSLSNTGRGQECRAQAGAAWWAGAQAHPKAPPISKSKPLKESEWLSKCSLQCLYSKTWVTNIYSNLFWLSLFLNLFWLPLSFSTWGDWINIPLKSMHFKCWIPIES